jgi:PAS domain S-box-containing protein
MHAALLPRNERQRVAALHKLHILDTPPEPSYDRIVELAARLFDMPIAVVAFVDSARQWFKAAVGTDLRETDRDGAFCAHSILRDDDEAFIVSDALGDSRFSGSPLVTGDLGVRFFAGQPVRAPGGERIGTLCVIDRRPRLWEERDAAILRDLALLVEQLLARPDNDAAEALRRSESHEALVMETMHDGLVSQDRDGYIIQWNAAAERLLGLTGAQLVGRTCLDPRWQAVHADGTAWPGDDHPAMQALRSGLPVRDETMGIERPGDGRAWLQLNSTPVVEPDGVVSGVVTTFVDISAEVQAGHENTAKATVMQTPVGAYDMRLVESALERFTAQLRSAVTQFEREITLTERNLDAVRGGIELRAMLSGSTTSTSRDNLTGAISSVEEARRVARLHLFRGLLAEGCSIGDVARIWGVSRQLASRILREGRADG